MDPADLLMTAARAAAVYLLMLVVVRALGRRTVGNFSAFDLLVALMLGEIVDEMIYGDIRFIQGTVAIVTIAATAYVDSFLSFWKRPIQRLLEGRPAIVVRNGSFDREGMRAERMNEADVLGALRKQGIRDMREVQYAVVEADGSVSVVPFDWAEKVIKADLDEQMARRRDRALGGRDEPPPRCRTDSNFALDQQPSKNAEEHG